MYLTLRHVSEQLTNIWRVETYLNASQVNILEMRNAFKVAVIDKKLLITGEI